MDLDESPETWIEESRTFDLRWHGGILEQAWKVKEIVNGGPPKIETIWRPIPHVRD